MIIADAERDRRPVRRGEPRLIQDQAGLLSESKINNNGIKLSALQ
jgi:hypothetical protein